MSAKRTTSQLYKVIILRLNARFLPGRSGGLLELDDLLLQLFLLLVLQHSLYQRALSQS